MKYFLLYLNFDKSLNWGLSYKIFYAIIFCCRFEDIVLVLISRQTLQLEKWSSSKKSMLRFVGFNWNIRFLVCWTSLGPVFWAGHRGGWKCLSQRSDRYFESSEPWSGPQPEGENIGLIIKKAKIISRSGTFLMSWTRTTRPSPWRSSRSWWWLWRKLAGGSRNPKRWRIVHRIAHIILGTLLNMKNYFHAI